MTTAQDLIADIAADLSALEPAHGTDDHLVPRNLPNAFWESRPVLTHIRAAAHARARSADAVLGAFLARTAALVPPSIHLPNPVGEPATLDFAVALIGPSGSGKSGSADTASHLLPFPNTNDPVTVPLGSGEGLVEAYMGEVIDPDDDRGTRKTRRQVRRAALFMLDEGQALAELGSRKGATILQTVRTAWSGNRLGQANASEDKRRNLPPREYRFALIAGFQTEHAPALLADAAGGTPQRFLFLSATDAAIPDDASEHPGPLTWTPPAHQTGAMTLDPIVASEIRREAVAVTRGEIQVAELDAHRNLVRLKVAGLLALLDNRLHIDARDWSLAGQVLDTSDAVRTHIGLAERTRAAAAQRAADSKAVQRDAARDLGANERAVTAMAKSIARHVHKNRCPDGCRRRCVTHATRSDDRKRASIEDALDLAQEQGWVVVVGDVVHPGEDHP